MFTQSLDQFHTTTQFFRASIRELFQFILVFFVVDPFLTFVGGKDVVMHSFRHGWNTEGAYLIGVLVWPPDSLSAEDARNITISNSF